jgi:hypothetical protein
VGASGGHPGALRSNITHRDRKAALSVERPRGCWFVVSAAPRGERGQSASRTAGSSSMPGDDPQHASAFAKRVPSWAGDRRSTGGDAPASRGDVEALDDLPGTTSRTGRRWRLACRDGAATASRWCAPRRAPATFAELHRGQTAHARQMRERHGPHAYAITPSSGRTRRRHRSSRWPWRPGVTREEGGA